MNYGKIAGRESGAEALGRRSASSDLQLVLIRQLALFKESKAKEQQRAGTNRQAGKTTLIQAH